MYTDSNASILTRYLREISTIPLLKREQEEACAIRAAQGDVDAKNLLIQANLRFVVVVAKRYRNLGLPFEDLINEGCIGLMRAVERFDPEKGYHFISYAVWWIRQAIVRALCEHSRMIRLPAHRIKELVQLDRAKNECLKETGIEPGVAELAKLLCLDTEHVKELMAIAQSTVSLDSPADGTENETTLGELIQDFDGEDIDTEVLLSTLRDELNKLLGILSEKEASIIIDRFGLNGRRSKSLIEIGNIYHLTKERIRQIEQRAIRKLRQSAWSQRLKTYLQ